MILESILSSLTDGEVKTVCMGLNWTAVVAEVDGQRRCGLASTQSHSHDHSPEGRVPLAGTLESLSARQLAEYVLQEMPALASIGMAAVNALLPKDLHFSSEANGEQIILEHAHGGRVALVGHFPFIPHLRGQVQRLDVLELEPQAGDLPASMAPEVIPQADVVALTALTLMNRTLEELLSLRSPGAYVVLLGPSAPLIPLMFDFGIDAISGSIVTEEEPVLKTIMQGGNFRQVHKAGIRLVNLIR